MELAHQGPRLHRRVYSAHGAISTLVDVAKCDVPATSNTFELHRYLVQCAQVLDAVHAEDYEDEDKEKHLRQCRSRWERYLSDHCWDLDQYGNAGVSGWSRAMLLWMLVARSNYLLLSNTRGEVLMRYVRYVPFADDFLRDQCLVRYDARWPVARLSSRQLRQAVLTLFDRLRYLGPALKDNIGSLATYVAALEYRTAEMLCGPPLAAHVHDLEGKRRLWTLEQKEKESEEEKKYMANAKMVHETMWWFVWLKHYVETHTLILHQRPQRSLRVEVDMLGADDWKPSIAQCERPWLWMLDYARQLRSERFRRTLRDFCLPFDLRPGEAEVAQRNNQGERAVVVQVLSGSRPPNTADFLLRLKYDRPLNAWLAEALLTRRQERGAVQYSSDPFVSALAFWHCLDSFFHTRLQVEHWRRLYVIFQRDPFFFDNFEVALVHREPFIFQQFGWWAVYVPFGEGTCNTHRCYETQDVAEAFVFWAHYHLRLCRGQLRGGKYDVAEFLTSLLDSPQRSDN